MKFSNENSLKSKLAKKELQERFPSISRCLLEINSKSIISTEQIMLCVKAMSTAYIYYALTS